MYHISICVQAPLVWGETWAANSTASLSPARLQEAVTLQVGCGWWRLVT